MTPVIFKLDRESKTPVAFFPTLPGDRSPYTMSSYAHIGQHSAASVEYLRDCKKATQAQYADLLAELHRVGYDDLRIVKRHTRKHTETRRAEIRAQEQRGSLDQFTAAYIEALFFTDNTPRADRDEYAKPGYEPAEGSIPCDADLSDIAPDTLDSIVRECAQFQGDAAALLTLAYERDGYSAARAGHDFWLTRNGHGAGFWDRRELEADGLGDDLAALCGHGTKYPGRDSYWGDDRRVYLA